MPRKRGIINDLEGAWHELTVVFRKLFGRTKIFTLPLTIENKIKEEIFPEKTANCFTDWLYSPVVKSLEEKIIHRETIPVHFTKLNFHFFSLPLTFGYLIKEVELLFSSKTRKEELINPRLNPRDITIRDNFATYCNDFFFFLKEGSVLDNWAGLENIPVTAKKKSFQELTPQDIVSFWQLLLEQTKVPRENLEFVGIYEPIPLHKLREIKFDSKSNNVNLFVSQENNSNQNKPVRLLVGRDKKESRIFTVVMPL